MADSTVTPDEISRHLQMLILDLLRGDLEIRLASWMRQTEPTALPSLLAIRKLKVDFVFHIAASSERKFLFFTIGKSSAVCADIRISFRLIPALQSQPLEGTIDTGDFLQVPDFLLPPLNNDLNTVRFRLADTEVFAFVRGAQPKPFAPGLPAKTESSVANVPDVLFPAFTDSEGQSVAFDVSLAVQLLDSLAKWKRDPREERLVKWQVGAVKSETTVISVRDALAVVRSGYREMAEAAAGSPKPPKGDPASADMLELIRVIKRLSAEHSRIHADLPNIFLLDSVVATVLLQLDNNAELLKPAALLDKKLLDGCGWHQIEMVAEHEFERGETGVYISFRLPDFHVDGEFHREVLRAVREKPEKFARGTGMNTGEISEFLSDTTHDQAAIIARIDHRDHTILLLQGTLRQRRVRFLYEIRLNVSPVPENKVNDIDDVKLIAMLGPGGSWEPRKLEPLDIADDTFRLAQYIARLVVISREIQQGIHRPAF